MINTKPHKVGEFLPSEKQLAVKLFDVVVCAGKARIWPTIWAYGELVNLLALKVASVYQLKVWSYMSEHEC